ncbi:IS630 family transposase [Pseudonocardia sp.]|uniref:IS630 family transposase n=1 Tax=Pseudonocardia sp. TaxID=60912 RepID=UPI0031FCE9EB
MSVAAPLVLREGDRSRLEALTRSSSVSAGLAGRARIVLLAAEGLSNTEIARRAGTSRPTVLDWRARYDTGGIRALDDLPRSGRPPEIDEIDVVVATIADEGRPPAHLGVTHWSARLLAAELKISFATVARIWRKWDLQPWRVETFKFSTDPELDAKIRDVVGLYLHPPEKAVVLCVDEKSQVQALDRTAPILPIMPGVPERQTHDYVRNGTTTLFAALDVATGRVEQACLPRHRHQEFLRFLRQVAKAYPKVKLHLVLDNYATHKHPAVQAWLARNPRITLHFTPTSGSWLNMVEIFFGIITRQAIRRGTFGSVRDLTQAITAFINGWNERCQPFTWTKDADTIIAKAHRQPTSGTRH